MSERPFFSRRAHWGYPVALVVVLGCVALFVIFTTTRYLLDEHLPLAVPTSGYAQQVGYKLMWNIGMRVNAPSELFRWRETGLFDRTPEFSPAAQFWFTYDSSDKSYVMQPVQLAAAPNIPENWKGALTEVLDSILVEKSAGHMALPLTLNDREYRLEGRVYRDQPQIVGLITDMEEFRQQELPAIFRDAVAQFPLLDDFSMGPEEGPGHSPLFVLAKDAQGGVIASIGIPGEYAEGQPLDATAFIHGYPYSDTFGFSLEIVIPRCIDKAFISNIKRAFYIFIGIWILTIMAWIKAEVRLKKARTE